MPDAIVYCDRCMKMILPSDIRVGGAQRTKHGGLCARCYAKLTGGAKAPASSAAPDEPPAAEVTAEPPSPRRKSSGGFRSIGSSARVPSGQTGRQRQIHAESGRGVARKPNSNMTAALVAACTAAGVAVVAVLIALSGSGKREPVQPRTDAPLTPVAVPPIRPTPSRESSRPQLGGLVRHADMPNAAELTGTSGHTGGTNAADGPSITSGLIGYWQLDEMRGDTARDSSGLGREANLGGSPKWLPYGGRVGGGLLFDARDGTEDYVVLPKNEAFNTLQLSNYTIAAWVKPESKPFGALEANTRCFAIVVKAGYHTGLQYESPGQFSAGHLFYDKTAVNAKTERVYEPGQFHHVAMVLDSSRGRLTTYVDGSAETTVEFQAGKSATIYDGVPWRIGIANPGAQEWGWAMHGVIDDVRLYSRALSDEEITMILAAADKR